MIKYGLYGHLHNEKSTDKETWVAKQVVVTNMTVVPWFGSIHHPLRLVQVFPMPHNGRTRPEAGR